MTEHLFLYPWLVPTPPRPSKPKMIEIAKLVAERCNITVDDMRGPSRYRNVAWPRQEAMSLIYGLGGRSTPQIGRFFNRDHATVLHSLKAHAARMAAAAAAVERDAAFSAGLSQIAERASVARLDEGMAA